MATKETAIHFGGRQLSYGIKLVHLLEAEWNQELTLPPEYQTLTNKITALEEMALTIPQFDLPTMVMNHPVKDWEKVLKEKAKDEALRSFFYGKTFTAPALATNNLGSHTYTNHYEEALGLLKTKRENVIDGVQLYDHIIQQLDTETAVEEFTSAAQALGESVYDIQRAADQDGEALTSFRLWGRRLAPLARLCTGVTGTMPAAVFADLGVMPELTRDFKGKSYALNSDHLYSDEDRYRHGRAQKVIDQASSTGEYITELAFGTNTDLTFSIAKNINEVRDRTKRMNALGEYTDINKKTK